MDGRDREGGPDGDSRPHAVVLGAGVCGLYAGLTLARGGMRVTVLEREDVVGGLAAGHPRNGNFYDLGVHHLHAFDREIFEDIRDLMGERMIGVEKSAKIRYGRGYRRYPLEFFDLLTGIPPWTLARALFGLIVQQLRARWRPREAANAEEALIDLYGRPLYRFFFKDFTARYWGMPPSELSATFVRRKMPRLSAVDVIKKALGRFGLRERRGAAVESAVADETLYYSRTGSREMPRSMARGIEDLGGEVRTDAPAVAVEHQDGHVIAVRYRQDGEEHRAECDVLVSTIPINLLVGFLDPPPREDVLHAARKLRHRPLVVYGLRVRKDRLLDALYIYYRDRTFHRLAEPKNSGLRIDPPHHTILLVELMCEVDDARWNAAPEAVAEVMDDLEAEGILHRDDVAEMQVIHAEHGYPVFELGFEEHLDAVRGVIDGLDNAWSTGRQGDFCYPNMHSSMRMGADAAEEAIAHWQARQASGQ